MSTGAYVGIPTSYTPVDYLESTGTQYVDTGIVRDITKVFRFVASVKWNDVSTRQCIGAQGYVYFGVSGGKYQIAQGGTTTTNVTATTGSFANIDLTFNCPSSTCTGTVNNTSIGTISATYQNSPTNAHIHLFSLNDLVLPCSVQIASFKIYQNNVLVRDFAPALDENNVACMFDLVENKFYYNKGSGTFSYGTASTPVTVGSFARKVKKIYVGIPTSYTPVEYIESSGTQYIDTGIKTNSNYKIETEISNFPSTGSAWRGVFGSRSSNSSSDKQLLQLTSSNYYLFAYGSYDNNFSSGIDLTTKTKITINKNVATIGNTSKTGTAATFTSAYSTYIFAINNANSPVDKSSYRLHSFKIYNDSNTLVRDFIPALDQGNTPCLYESVEGKFYYNKGTGTFTYGTAGEPVVVGNFARKVKKAYVGVPVSYTPVEYIGSSGTQYIDLGITVQAAGGTHAKLDISFSNFTNLQQITGVYNGESQRYNLRATTAGVILTHCTGTSGDKLITGPTATVNTRYLIEAKLMNGSQFLKVNDTTYGTKSLTGLTFPSNINLNLLAIYDVNNGIVGFTSGKLYSAKYYNSSGSLIRDFIPVLDENNVACLYEQVEGKFYYNKGTGTFTAGSTTSEPVVESRARLCFKGTYTIEDLDRFVNDTTVYNAQPESYIKNAITWYKNNKATILQYYTSAGLDINSYTDFYIHGDTTYYEFFALKPNDGSTFTINYNSSTPSSSYISYSSVEKTSRVRYNYSSGYWIGFGQGDLPQYRVTGLNSITPPSYQYFVLANYYNG